MSNMDFSNALKALKAGERVRRAGWNGKGMWLALIKVGEYTVSKDAVLSDFSSHALLPWIGMRTADSKFVPWLASQTDLLSNDWELV